MATKVARTSHKLGTVLARFLIAAQVLILAAGWQSSSPSPHAAVADSGITHAAPQVVAEPGLQLVAYQAR